MLAFRHCAASCFKANLVNLFWPVTKIARKSNIRRVARKRVSDLSTSNNADTCARVRQTGDPFLVFFNNGMRDIFTILNR